MRGGGRPLCALEHTAHHDPDALPRAAVGNLARPAQATAFEQLDADHIRAARLDDPADALRVARRFVGQHAQLGAARDLGQRTKVGAGRGLLEEVYVQPERRAKLGRAQRLRRRPALIGVQPQAGVGRQRRLQLAQRLQIGADVGAELDFQNRKPARIGVCRVRGDVGRPALTVRSVVSSRIFPPSSSHSGALREAASAQWTATSSAAFAPGLP